MKKFLKVLQVSIILAVFMMGCSTLDKKEAIIHLEEENSIQNESIPEEENLSEIESVPEVENSGEKESLPEEYFIETENYFDYQTGMECSAFASAYVLRHFGIEATGTELYKDYPGKLDNGGVMPSGIIQFFDDQGYEAEFVENGTLEDLKMELCKGTPVIVFIHVVSPYTSCHDTHYVPMVGYDSDYVYLAESMESFANAKGDETLPYNRKVDNTYFLELWENIDGYWDYPYFVISQ